MEGERANFISQGYIYKASDLVGEAWSRVKELCLNKMELYPNIGNKKFCYNSVGDYEDMSLVNSTPQDECVSFCDNEPQWGNFTSKNTCTEHGTCSGTIYGADGNKYEGIDFIDLDTKEIEIASKATDSNGNPVYDWKLD